MPTASRYLASQGVLGRVAGLFALAHASSKLCAPQHRIGSKEGPAGCGELQQSELLHAVAQDVTGDP
jgi:hypothetical protein